MNNNNKMMNNEINNNTNRIYVCPDSIEGIFSAVYDIYSDAAARKTSHDNCKITVGAIGNFELFSEYIDVATDTEKALKVTKTVCERLGYEAYEAFLYAAACDDERKGTAIYKCIYKGLKMKNGFRLLNMWTDSDVVCINELRRRAGNEFTKWREFMEFKELKGNLLFSRIGPVCDILMFLAPHFTNRLPNENFMIYDEIRDKYLVHEKSRQCVIVAGNGDDFDEDGMRTESDLIIDSLFNVFTTTIAIKERTNHKLQQQLLPLRLQKYKIEF